MRTSHLITALAAFTAGVTAATLRRRGGIRPTAATTTLSAPASEPDREAVVLPFARPVTAGPASEQPSSPARCGESGGRTKAGAPCGARTTTGGRCRHHPMAA